VQEASLFVNCGGESFNKVTDGIHARRQLSFTTTILVTHLKVDQPNDPNIKEHCDPGRSTPPVPDLLFWVL
jgi:hypothetical protein